MKINLVRGLYDDEEPILDVLPAEPLEANSSRTESISTVWGLFEVLLKAPARLDAFVRESSLQGKLLLGFSTIVVVGFALYGLVMSLLLIAVSPNGVPSFLEPGWSRTWRAGVILCLTYPVGLLLATVICLPSYYYFALLGGVQMSLRETLTHSLKGKAATTVILLGILPIYAIVMVGFLLVRPSDELLRGGMYVGLLLPFILGVRGAQSIFSGFRTVVNALPASERKRRYALPGWLVFVWASLFTVTAPLVLYEVWRHLSGL